VGGAAHILVVDRMTRLFQFAYCGGSNSLVGNAGYNFFVANKGRSQRLVGACC